MSNSYEIKENIKVPLNKGTESHLSPSHTAPGRQRGEDRRGRQTVSCDIWALA